MSQPIPTSRAYATIKPLLWLVSLAIFMQMLDATIVNTALPSMARSLHESPLQMQSVVFSYALAVAMFIPASGWIADRFGTRRTFLVAIIVFTLGSLLCAAARNSCHNWWPRAWCRASVGRCCCRWAGWQCSRPWRAPTSCAR